LRLICPNGAYGELLLWLRRLGAEEAYLAMPLGLETPILPAGRNMEGLLAEALPLAMRLMAHPRLLIVRDHVRFLSHGQKERLIEVLAAYAKQHTVLVFSGESLWHETTQRVHELTTPTDANA
jgi:ABC-type multidrug transport system fused ATPase/permease subunit